MERKQWLVVLLAGLIGTGLALAVGACGEDDKGSVNVEGGTTGSTGGTSTTPVTVDTTASDPDQLEAAMVAGRRVWAHADGRERCRDKEAPDGHRLRERRGLQAGLRRRAPLLRAHRAACRALPRARRQDRRSRGRVQEGRGGPRLDRLPPDRARALQGRQDHGEARRRSPPASSRTPRRWTMTSPGRRSRPRWSSPAPPSWSTRSRSRRSRARRSATRSSTSRRSWRTSRARGVLHGARAAGGGQGPRARRSDRHGVRRTPRRRSTG